MPRFFFDTYNGSHCRDDVGQECPDVDAARKEAIRSLPEIATFAIPADGDLQAYTVLVRDEEGALVYTATLTFAGLRLDM